MAAPKNPQRGPNPKKAPKRNRSKRNDVLFEETRSKIQATQIVNRFNKYILGEDDVKMEPSQVTAGLGLLKFVLPSLQSTELSGDAENPLSTDVKVTFVSEKQEK